MRIYAKKVQFFLVNSKKSSTFARFFARRGERVALSPLIGAPENLSIFGESESKAKIHMSDVVANRIEPSLARSPGGGIGRRVGLKHQWETVPVRSRPWVLVNEGRVGAEWSTRDTNQWNVCGPKSGNTAKFI